MTFLRASGFIITCGASAHEERSYINPAVGIPALPVLTIFSFEDLSFTYLNAGTQLRLLEFWHAHMFTPWLLLTAGSIILSCRYEAAPHEKPPTRPETIAIINFSGLRLSCQYWTITASC